MNAHSTVESHEHAFEDHLHVGHHDHSDPVSHHDFDTEHDESSHIHFSLEILTHRIDIDASMTQTVWHAPALYAVLARCDSPPVPPPNTQRISLFYS